MVHSTFRRPRGRFGSAVVLLAASYAGFCGAGRGRSEEAAPTAVAADSDQAVEIQSIRDTVAAHSLKRKQLTAQIALLGVAISATNDLDRPGETFWRIQMFNTTDEQIGQLAQFAEELEAVGRVQELLLTGREVTNGGLSHVAQFSHLEQIRIQDTAITDAGLSRLAGLTELNSLSIGDSSVNGIGLRFLQNCPKLRTLNLAGESFTDTGLANIGKLKQLRQLTIRDADVSGTCIASWKNCENLHRLRLIGPQTDGTHLKHLSQIPKLKQFNISESDISDEQLAALSAVKTLEELTVSSPLVTDAGLAHLKPFSELRTISLYSSSVTDDGLLHLTELDNLRFIHLSGCEKLTTDALQKLSQALPRATIYPPRSNQPGRYTDVGNYSKLPTIGPLEPTPPARPAHIVPGSPADRAINRIEELGGRVGLHRSDAGESVYLVDLHETTATDDDMKLLQHFPQLAILDIDHTNIGDDGLRHADGHRYLQRLTGRHTQITGRGFAALKDVPHLHDVILTGSPVNDDGVKHLVAIPTIRSLSLGTDVTDVGMVHVGRMTQLNYLDLYASKVTSAGLVHLKEMPVLFELRLQRTGLTDEGLTQLPPLPHLEGLSLDGTAITGQSFHHLSDFPQLRFLSITETKVDDASVAKLAESIYLEFLRTAGSRLTPQGLAELKLKNPAIQIDDSLHILKAIDPPPQKRPSE